MQQAQTPPAKTERERAYIAALSDFFKPGKQDFQTRIDAYSAAMGKLYEQYPDVDSGAFYALSLLAAVASNDTSLANEHKAMAVLVPLFAKYPDNPGVVHYIIHSCDNPAMASEALGGLRSLWPDCAGRCARRPHARTHLRAARHVAAGHHVPTGVDRGIGERREARRGRPDG